MPANIKGFRFEGSELVVDLELRITFGIGTELPGPAKAKLTSDLVEARRVALHKYYEKHKAKAKAAAAKKNEVSEEKLQRMQALQNQLKQIQEEMANAIPERP